MKKLALVVVLTLFACTKDSGKPEEFSKTKFSLEVSLNPTNAGTVSPSSGEFEEGTEVLITVSPNSDYEFKDWSGDISGTTNPIKLIMNSKKQIIGNLSELILESISVLNPIDTLVISNKHKFIVQGIFTNGSVRDISNLVTLEKADDRVTLLGNNEFTVGKKGVTSIKLKMGEIEIEESFYSSEIEYEEVDPKLISNDDCNLSVPIIILNLFPTKDGVFHDDSSGPSNYWELLNPALELSKRKVKETAIVSKKIVEYGTRFRDYGSGEVKPYVCLDVVKYINVYSWELVNWVNGRKTLNYFELFQKLGMEDYVNNLGVKEIWITAFGKDEYPSIINSGNNDPSTYWAIPESNMSSPLTGDISNSYRIQNDLPIYQKTYVVYGNSGHRGVDTNIHNRGHQIEVQMRHIEKNKIANQELFWNKFVGVSNNQQKQNGRSGNTHFPPNGESDYDYCQPNTIASDIKHWKPDGGEKEIVGCNTWRDIQYNIDMLVHDVNHSGTYNTDPHTKWLLFWFQSIPGENNNILYERDGVNYTLTNWWELFYNWDESIMSNKTLWE